MNKLAVALLLSSTLGAAQAAYEPSTFDVKMNHVASNPNRGEDGRNYFLNFQSVRNKAAEIKNNVRDNIKTTGIGRSIGGGGGGSGGGGGGICR